MEIVVPRGSVHVLLGPNGCGKSLLLDTVSGLHSDPNVTVLLDGKFMPSGYPYQRWKQGLRRLFQVPTLPGELSVEDLLEVSPSSENAPDSWKDEATALVDAAGVAAPERVGSLSFGQRRVVELCMAVASGRACLLDEPFAGLDDQLVTGARHLIRAAAERGQGILVVDHLSASHEWLYEQRHDWVFPQAPEPTNMPLLGKLLEAVSSRAPQRPLDRREFEITTLGIQDRHVIENAVFELGPGTALFVTGANGTGKSSLLRAIGGFPQPSASIRADVRSAVPGAFLSPQPPKLVDSLSVSENLRLMLSRGDTADSGDSQLAESLLRALGFQGSQLQQRAEVLSGGEASLVALVGACLSRCPVLLLDEPFESLTTRAIGDCMQLLRAVSNSGTAMVIATHPANNGHVMPAMLALERGGTTSGRFIGETLV